MNKIVSGILATTLSASFAATAVPANAAQMFVPQWREAASNEAWAKANAESASKEKKESPRSTPPRPGRPQSD